MLGREVMEDWQLITVLDLLGGSPGGFAPQVSWSAMSNSARVPERLRHLPHRQ